MGVTRNMILTISLKKNEDATFAGQIVYVMYGVPYVRPLRCRGPRALGRATGRLVPWSLRAPNSSVLSVVKARLNRAVVRIVRERRPPALRRRL